MTASLARVHSRPSSLTYSWPPPHPLLLRPREPPHRCCCPLLRPARSPPRPTAPADAQIYTRISGRRDPCISARTLHLRPDSASPPARRRIPLPRLLSASALVKQQQPPSDSPAPDLVPLLLLGRRRPIFLRSHHGHRGLFSVLCHDLVREQKIRPSPMGERVGARNRGHRCDGRLGICVRRWGIGERGGEDDPIVWGSTSQRQLLVGWSVPNVFRSSREAGIGLRSEIDGFSGSWAIPEHALKMVKLNSEKQLP